jgi:DNA-binding CsgD family transcriptional regulator
MRMPTTSLLRECDFDSIWKLAGACRELGYDPNSWRRQLLKQLFQLVGFDVGYSGERARCLALCRCPGRATGRLAPRSRAADLLPMFERDLAFSAAPHLDLRQHMLGVGADHSIRCFRSIAAGVPDDFSALVLIRDGGRPAFSARDRAMVGEVHALLTPLIGGPLTHFAEPSPLDLPLRVQEVLWCLLEGSGDKQIAAQLKLSRFTINQYNKLIYRHFSVVSRPELLARWIRRGMSPFRSNEART